MELADFFQSKGLEITITADLAALDACEHMLLYLTSATWTRGEESAAFAHEVCEALRKGVHLLVCHEFPSMLGDGEGRHACAFNDFWREGWTPRWLLKGDANVYKQIAIALKGGAWREAGLAKLAQALAKGGGDREAWRASPEEPPEGARAIVGRASPEEPSEGAQATVDRSRLEAALRPVVYANSAIRWMRPTRVAPILTFTPNLMEQTARSENSAGTRRVAQQSSLRAGLDGGGGVRVVPPDHAPTLVPCSL